VIGANAVVTGEIPDFSVAVGSPARVVRRYLSGHGWVRHDASGGIDTRSPRRPTPRLAKTPGCDPAEFAAVEADHE
jgi:hypothetical protein